jgi:putative membrane-bound dehydrogenase-like protein
MVSQTTKRPTANLACSNFTPRTGHVMTRIATTLIILASICLLVFATAATTDDGWTTIRVPGGWKDDAEKRFEKYDGFAWYRASVRVPPGWAGQEAHVSFYQLSNSIEVFWNGERIGAAGVMPPDFRAAYGTNVRYAIPAKKVNPGGVSALAIRVYDQGGRGGFKSVAPAVVQGDKAILLEGNWQFRTGDDAAWSARNATPSNDETLFSSIVDAATVLNKSGSAATPLSPADALATMTVTEGLEIEQVLAEPIVGQPLSISFDERGRMWVVQYLQYPDPAGLTVVSRDKFWRVVYDKVSPPPPNHFKGRDKITIHEDTDGDGRFDKHTTFVDGLNIATAAARGRGGVWVMNPPYLLFYPDRDNDDVPDGDPVVHLEGFGLEDTHSVASSLCWGPDGWLYASQGSTVSGNIVRPGLDKQPVHSMGQLIWRYHPETRRYEIFAEGGGNAFGVEIDSKGRVYSGHNGGDTRGFHYVQGGYFQKGFNKHGPLSNPYTFGYFTWMKHHNVPRFTHTFLIYEAAGRDGDVLEPLPPSVPHATCALGESYRGKLYGVAPLLSHVVQAEVTPDGSSFQTKDLSHPVTTKDTYFRPVDIKAGPDGALYVADFYEERIAHLVHHDGQIDPGTGRVYRVKAAGSKPMPPFDLSKLSSRELIQVLHHENKWFRQVALRLIADRKDASIVPELRQAIDRNTGQFALECLWALNLCGGLDDPMAVKTLKHQDPYVRLWTTRLLCDPGRVAPEIAKGLIDAAEHEKNVEARSQLACSAKRLPAYPALPIILQLMKHSEDTSDVHIPLLLWWAIEAKCESDREDVVKMFQDPGIWRLPLVETHIEERLMRRFAASGTQADLAACARLLQLAPGAGHVKQLMAGFEKAYAGRALAGLPDELAQALAEHAGKSVVLGLRQNRDEAIDAALAVISNDKADKTEQLQYVQIFGELSQPRCVPALLKIVTQGNDDALRGAAITALLHYDDPAIAATVIENYGKFNDDLKAVALTLMSSRTASTIQFLEAVDRGKIEPGGVPLEVVQKFTLHHSDRIAALVAKHWGQLRPATSEELQREVGRLATIIKGNPGSPWAGKKLFMSQCGKCHKLFDQGGQIGPDLTSYKRDDIDTLLLHVVNPSAEIREGFENYVIATRDGRTLSGFLTDQTNRVVIVRGQDGQTVSIPRDEIDEMQVTKTSIMPEGQLKQYNEQQIRDLFAYLRSSQPLNE